MRIAAVHRYEFEWQERVDFDPPVRRSKRVRTTSLGSQAGVPEPTEKLSPATAEDLAKALAFALRFEDRKRVHNGGEIVVAIVARRLVDHLERADLSS